MRKVLIPYVAAAVVLGAAAAAFFFFWPKLMFGRALSFASSVVAENTPIAELATRRIVWRVFTVDSSVAKDSYRDTIYTIKAGYDLAQIEVTGVDAAAKTVTISLPPPKLVSVDYFLQRNAVEKKTFFERVFGANVEDGAADRADLAKLIDDCDRYGLLSSADLRESIEKLLADRLKTLCGYTLVVTDGRDLPAKVLFDAYAEEKGVSL